MIYWTLIPYDFSNYISDVYIKIHADEAFPDTTPVWGYGNYGGTAYVYDGYIEMQPQNGLGTDEYMTVLVQFPKGTFNANNSLNHDFDYYYEMAENGAEHYENNGSNLFITIIEVIFQIAMVLFVPTIILIVIMTSGQGMVDPQYCINLQIQNFLKKILNISEIFLVTMIFLELSMLDIIIIF